MSGNVPDLIIPIRMDPSKATAALAKVSAAGKKAGDDVDAGAKKAKQGLDDMSGGAEAAGAAMLGLSAAQFGLSVVHTAAAAVGEEFKRAADYVKKLAEDFAGLRKTMGELAALTGVPNSNKFTVEQAKRGQKYGMTPEENRQAQEVFKNYAGVNVGDELDAAGQPTGRAGKGAKLTEAQGEEFSGRIALMMKSVGQKPSLGLELGGAMLQQAKGPQDVDKLMKDFQETYAISQKGPVDVKEMIPELQRIMSHDIAPQDAAKMFNIVAPAAGKGQEGTSVEGALRAIQEMKNENTGTEYGVKRGMSDMDSVRAFGENIAERKKKMMAGGKDEKTALDDLQAQLSERGIAKDIREARGLVRGFGQQGVEHEGFTQYDEVQRNVPADLEKIKAKEYKKSDQGLDDAEAIRDEVARAVRGEQQQNVRREILRAKADVTESGELEKPSIGHGLRQINPFQKVELEQQIINRQALTNVGQRAAEAGVETPYDPRSAIGRANITMESNQNQLQVNKDIAELLQKILVVNQKMADAAVKQPAAVPAKSLDAKPPGPVRNMGS